MAGHVTSSYYSACLGRSIALALVTDGRRRHGEVVQVPRVGAEAVAAVIGPPQFYDPGGERQNA